MIQVGTEGLELFGMVRNADKDTPRLAAQKVLPKVSGDRQRVKECHEAHPEGLTDFQLAALLGGSQTSLGKRRLELGGIDTGRRERAPSGAWAIVWTLP